MAWFKVDDRFAEHPKVLHARALGGFGPLGLWLAAGTWSNTHLTDGFIPEPWVQINQGTEFAEFLVDAGLWLRVEGGWEFKDFTEYQPSKAEVEAKRAETSAARSAAGKASATKRQQSGNKRGTNREQTFNPVPVPVPEPEPRGSLSTRESTRERTKKVSPIEQRRNDRRQRLQGGAT